jgi:dTDP-4-amino-4,6-dideoxygalactose transaminase
MAPEDCSTPIFLSPPHLGGQESFFIAEALQSNYIAPAGPQIEAFEREFGEIIGHRHAVAVSSGTAAIHLAMRILDVSPGDEVIVSTLTFIGSVSPVVFQGGIPVFIDSDLDSWNMDTGLLAEELQACARRGQLPKAVVPTDIYGQCADLRRILEICRPYSIPVVVDAAESLGASYKGFDTKPGEGLDGYLHAGIGGKAAAFSFNGNKIITTSGGGMLSSDDHSFIEEARFLSQQAKDPAPHYEHSTVGYNYRMSNISAAIGRGQLRILKERVEQKRRIFDHYHDGLSDIPGIELMPEASHGRCTRWLTVLLIEPEEFGEDREAVRLSLSAENIESRPVWKPMHLQAAFDTGCAHKKEEKAIGGMGTQPRLASGKTRHRARAVGGAVSEKLFRNGLCLPSGTGMSDRDLARVIGVIRKIHTRGRKQANTTV